MKDATRKHLTTAEADRSCSLRTRIPHTLTQDPSLPITHTICFEMQKKGNTAPLNQTDSPSPLRPLRSPPCCGARPPSAASGSPRGRAPPRRCRHPGRASGPWCCRPPGARRTSRPHPQWHLRRTTRAPPVGQHRGGAGGGDIMRMRRVRYFTFNEPDVLSSPMLSLPPSVHTG